MLRGEGEEFVIKTPEIRIPPNFTSFLSNGKNKERLFELVEEVWVNNKKVLGTRTVYFARSDRCTKISNRSVDTVEELQTNHEEADTKICYLLHFAMRNNGGQETSCVVRSCSGDIDMPIILLANEDPNLHILIENGVGKGKKLLDLTQCELSPEQKQALLGLHAFTGNDYVSSFFRRGKSLCWKLIQENAEFLEIFSELGQASDASENLIAGLEKFVCSLYGEKRLTSVDDARRKIFWKNFTRDEKITDLSSLPPCRSSLLLHIKRANLVARTWRQAAQPMIVQDDPTMHGWKDDFSCEWVSEAYPEDLCELLIANEEAEPDAEMADYESSDEED